MLHQKVITRRIGSALGAMALMAGVLSGVALVGAQSASATAINPPNTGSCSYTDVNIAQTSASVGHCLTRAKSLPDHTHDGSDIVKSAVVGVIPAGNGPPSSGDAGLVEIKMTTVSVMFWRST